MKSSKYSNNVIVWLFVGLVMIYIQVLVGGVTRLTESGLSITKWEVISGSIPPLSDIAWQNEFDLYKSTPQYKEINEGMSLSDFKFIYFWEFVHRFWARIMGFVFLFPFIYFLIKGKLDSDLIKRLSVVILLAVFAATFGWIMVASGLVERPWVNAYKLSIHLLIAFAVFSALLWAYLYARNITFSLESLDIKHHKSWLILFTVLLVLQIFFGGVMSGMKAAVIYPTWPDMNGLYFPDIIFNRDQWSLVNFNSYDKNIFMPTLIHFLHRNMAYLLFFTGIILVFKLFILGKRLINKYLVYTSLAIFVTLLIQILLGITTVVNSLGRIPVLWGVLHQAFALLLLGNVVFVFFILRIKKY